jgi:hypothetical protein
MFIVVSHAASGSASSFPGTIFIALLTALFDDSVDEPADVGGFRNIRNHRQAFAAERRGVLCRRLCGRRIDVIDHDMRALARIGESNVAADTAACARDERHLVLQSHGVPPILKITRKNHAKSAPQGAQVRFRPRKWRP